MYPVRLVEAPVLELTAAAGERASVAVSAAAIAELPLEVAAVHAAAVR